MLNLIFPPVIYFLTTFLYLHGGDVKLKGSRPNIILILTDDQGMGDLSCMGNPVLKTPELDKLYAKSIRFTDFHVSPTCAPTRGALMSGRHPFEIGISHTIRRRERMALQVVTLPQALQKAGYRTGLFGKWHLGDEKEYLPQNRGFHEVLMHGAGGIGQNGLGDFEENSDNTYFDSVLLHNKKVVKSNGFCTDVFFNQALTWIRDQLETKPPFFAYISLNAPHGPMIAPELWKKRFLDQGYDEKTAARYGMIENIDYNFGFLKRKLSEWNALEKTLIIFMTDNGMSMGAIQQNGKRLLPYNAGLRGGKNSPDEGGTRVPCFWYWQDKIKEGTDIKALTRHIDIYKTFCDLAGIEIPKSKLPPRGRSLLPLIKNSSAFWKDRQIFIHCGRWDDGRKNKFSREENRYKKCSIRTSRWRLVDNSKLYDISADPGQLKDVAEDYPEVISDLNQKYDRWWDSTSPFLVNEGLSSVSRGDHMMHKLSLAQSKNGKFPILQTSIQESKKNKFVHSDKEKPNFVVFLADDMGWGDSATYGHSIIKTPNLDNLASQGVKFTQFYSASGVCSPSRSAILTGRTPYRNGVWRHLSGMHPAYLRDSEVTYIELLKEIGYQTCHIGKWHLSSKPQFNNPEFPSPTEHGYDYWVYTHNNADPSHKQPENFLRMGEPVGKVDTYSAQFVADEAVKWLEQRNEDQPFALSVWLHEPHTPIATHPKFEAMYEGEKHKRYYGNITQLDDALGSVMAALDKAGERDNTVFFFTSDNGPLLNMGGSVGGLRGAKRSDHEGGIRVPGVVRWPAKIAAGTTSDIPVIGTDIFSTVLDIVGIEPPADRTIDGVSMIPAFTGKSLERKIPLFWRTHVSGADNRVALRIGDWKIVGNDTMTEFMLFDIQEDWKEENNLAGQMPEKLKELKKILFEVWENIEQQGPKEWWLNERQKPVKGAKLNY